MPTPDAPDDLHGGLESVRVQHGVPAMAAAVVRRCGTAAIGVAGVRTAGQPALVEHDDRFHIGSCTKAMTATVAAVLVEEGRLSWDTPLGTALRDLGRGLRPGYADVTLEKLLRHQGGVPSSPVAASPR